MRLSGSTPLLNTALLFLRAILSLDSAILIDNLTLRSQDCMSKWAWSYKAIIPATPLDHRPSCIVRARTFNPFTTHCVRIRACGQLAFKGFVYPGGGAAIRGAAQPRREVERGQLQFERVSSPRKRKRSPESPPGPGPSGLNRLSGVYKQAEGFSYSFFCAHAC